MALYNLNNITPCKTFCSGEYLKDELVAHGLSVAKFALRIKTPIKEVQDFIDGKHDITLSQSQTMGEALGLDGDFFWEMQQMYYEDLQKMKHTSQQHKHTIMPTLQRITKAIYRNLIL